MTIMIMTLPNLLSVLRILLTPIIFVAYINGGAYQVVAVALFTVAMLTDTFDGYYARRYSLQTRLGAFLDPIADKILVLTTFALFAWQGLLHWVIVLVMALRDIIVTVLRLKLVAQGVSMTTSKLGKGKTAAQFVSIYLFFMVNWFDMSYGNLGIRNFVLFIAQSMILVVVIMSVYSCFDYVVRYVNHENDGGKPYA